MECEEIWKPINSANGFEISNNGRARSVRFKKPRILIPQIRKIASRLYVRYWCKVSRKRKLLFIHTEAARAFLGIEQGRISFIDGNPFNCKARNLRTKVLTIKQKNFSNISLVGEKWKRLQGSQALCISDKGRIKDVSKSPVIFKMIKLYKPPSMNSEICIVAFLGTHKYFNNAYVHGLVAQAFLPNPNHHKRIKFINGNTTDCRAGNLEWEAESVDYAYIKDLTAKENKSNSEIIKSDYINGDRRGMDILIEKLAINLFPKLKYSLKVKNDDDVNDAIQCAILEVLQKVKRGMVKGDVFAYAYQIAKYEIFGIWRKQGKSLFRINDKGNEYCIEGPSCMQFD
jgi:hypothetical protein